MPAIARKPHSRVLVVLAPVCALLVGFLANSFLDWAVKTRYGLGVDHSIEGCSIAIGEERVVFGRVTSPTSAAYGHF